MPRNGRAVIGLAGALDSTHGLEIIGCRPDTLPATRVKRGPGDEVLDVEIRVGTRQVMSGAPCGEEHMGNKQTD